MRKLFTLLFLLTGFCFQNSNAQCTPDPTFVFVGAPGVFPIAALGIADGTINVPYSQTMTVIVPADTTIDLSAVTGIPGLPTLSVSVNYFAQGTATGLPSGLSVACDDPSCQWAGGTNGCFAISGTPTQAGTFPVDLDVNMNVDVPATVPVIGGSPLDIPIPSAYDLFVDGANDIAELNPDEFSVIQNGPNPFHEMSTILYTAPYAMMVDFEIRDITGSLVYENQVRAGAGTNSIELNGNNFTPGVYFYTLSNGKSKVTHKMIVQE